jgi:putative oxidoreductase
MQHIDSLPHQTIAPIARARQPHWVALLSTTDSALPTLLRVSLGGVIFAHGLQKVFGWFDGYGVAATMKFFASVGIPAPLGALVIVSDFFGSLALLLGLATRLSAFGAFAVMLGAMLIVHVPNGFFMN